VYADEGYLVVGSNKQMLIDDTKVLDVLDVFCAMFERFLACVDDQDTEVTLSPFFLAFQRAKQ